MLWSFERDAETLAQASQCGLNDRQYDLIFDRRAALAVRAASATTRQQLRQALDRAHDRAVHGPLQRGDPACSAVLDEVGGIATRAGVTGAELTAVLRGRK